MVEAARLDGPWAETSSVRDCDVPLELAVFAHVLCLKLLLSTLGIITVLSYSLNFVFELYSILIGARQMLEWFCWLENTSFPGIGYCFHLQLDGRVQMHNFSNTISLCRCYLLALIKIGAISLECH